MKDELSTVEMCEFCKDDPEINEHLPEICRCVVSTCTLCHAQHDEDMSCSLIGAKSGSFEAKYYSRCPWCNDQISPGDNVIYRGDRLYHEECV